MFLDVGSGPHVMGILNCTPDSFSDGGHYLDVDSAVTRALQMQAEGASIIDIGGESTRPGAQVISVDEELSRIVPVIQRIKQVSDIHISIDTSKPLVMQEVLGLGVSMINDVNALESEGALDAVANSDCMICLMHKKGMPEFMQVNPSYFDVVNEVFTYLNGRVLACRAKGITSERIILDVGFGFGKTDAHNLSLIKHLAKFRQLEQPLLVGVSRKSTIGAILNRPELKRIEGSLALAIIAYLNGAKFFRVHDVRQTYDALKIAQAVNHAT